MKNTKPVGSSEQVHGISDEYLAENGQDPKKTLEDLSRFIGDDPCVGHNVVFDISMLIEYSGRLGVGLDIKDYYDTLDMARRKVEAPNYKLGTLAEMFDLETATHDARDDVMATVGLLGVLVERLRKDQIKRKDLFAKYSAKFITLAGLLNSWRTMVRVKRPAEALKEIWKESGLSEYYAKDQDADSRQKSIDSLIELFVQKDDPNKRPEEIMQELIRFSALARDINFLGLDKGKVPIVTAHQ
ncbi:hypothetical protein GF382_03935, partial [Candidatus Falkowbacteria bacterium]|nr:hypothetical protein [Candidatus Falkowbacteria bacterium]